MTKENSGRLTSGKGYPARAHCVRPVIRPHLQWSGAIWPRTHGACRSVTHERPRSDIVNKVTHTLTCTHTRRFRDNSKLRMFAWCSACFPSLWLRFQTIVDEASSSDFRKQNAPQVATQRSLWTRFASRTLLSVNSHILTWFWAVLLTTRMTWGSTFGCTH